jgi:F-type H+-transporting ATPase subunit b
MHEFFAEPRSWVAIAFVIFFVLFGKKIWGALTAILDKHADAVRAELDEASRLRKEAEAMLAEASTRREAALVDARAMIAAAHAEAARVAEQAKLDAEASGKRREQMAMDRIAAAEKAAVTEVQLAAADIATRAAQEVIAATLSAAADAPIIDRAIAGLPAALTRRAA